MNTPLRTRRRRRISAAWMTLILFDFFVVALAASQDDPVRPEAHDPVIVQLEGPEDVADDEVRFEAIDVYLDAGDRPLAAYQLEVQSETSGVEIVGIEGGEHTAFAKPPYYDPKAMSNDRVILAAFKTGDNLPSGRTRVARIHVQLRGPGMKEYRTKVSVSADSEGHAIPTTIQIERAKA